MSTIEVGDSTERNWSPGPPWKLPAWYTRSLVACPKCRAYQGQRCFGGRGGARRATNHVERRLAAIALLEADQRSMGA